MLVAKDFLILAKWLLNSSTISVGSFKQELLTALEFGADELDLEGSNVSKISYVFFGLSL